MERKGKILEFTLPKTVNVSSVNVGKSKVIDIDKKRKENEIDYSINDLLYKISEMIEIFDCLYEELTDEEEETMFQMFGNKIANTVDKLDILHNKIANLDYGKYDNLSYRFKLISEISDFVFKCFNTETREENLNTGQYEFLILLINLFEQEIHFILSDDYGDKINLILSSGNKNQNIINELDELFHNFAMNVNQEYIGRI